MAGGNGDTRLLRLAYTQTSQVSARELATDLDVDFVLEGSIRHHAGAVRVNAPLVAGSDQIS